MDELQAVRSCTLGSTPSANTARNRNPEGWMFGDSRVRPGTQNVSAHVALAILEKEEP